MAGQGQSKAPLEGIIVIDLTRVLSGPYATMLLGDLGATIIKIEDPKSGDTTRHSAPFKNGQSHYFLSVNRNKQSVAIDLSSLEGKQLLRRLCKTAHVLIENFRPGTLERMGLSVPSLQAENQNLIACSISGFGQSGPLRDRIAYDIITQAMSGVLSTNGDPQSAPVRISVPLGDLTGGFLAVIGILAAIIGRDRGDFCATHRCQSARWVNLVPWLYGVSLRRFGSDPSAHWFASSKHRPLWHVPHERRLDRACDFHHPFLAEILRGGGSS